MVSFGFFALWILVTGGHVFTGYSSLFRSRELQGLFSSPYPPHRLFRIQCFETLILGGWLLGVFCVPILFAYGWKLQAAWWYYPTVLLGLGGFLVAAGAMGILITLFVARWIVGRPIRSTLAAAVLIGTFVGLFVYGITMNQKFFGAIDANKLGETLANMRLSSNPFLLSQWMSELMTAARIQDVGRSLLYLILLWASGLFFMSLVLEFGYHWYAGGWLWAQERVGLFYQRRERHRFRMKRLWLMRLFPRRIGPIVYKECHLFARDFSQWGQLVLILVLVLFYVAHTKNVTFENPLSPARNHLAFFNVVLLGFIQATLSLRYTFPSISLEGRGFWTVVTSEVGLGRFYFTKYYLHASVLLVIGQGMGFLLNNFLHIDTTLNWICAFLLFLFAFGFTSWTLSLGVLFRKFEAASAADVTSDVGTLITMICTLLYFGISIAFLARFALDHTPGMSIIDQLTINPDMILYSTLFLLIQTCAILLPTAYGLKKLKEISY
jgi:ABC-2 type transport system permease protein